jgi:hypothetical protein
MAPINILASCLVLLVFLPGFWITEQAVTRWASSAGLALTAESRRVVRRYLTWSRRSRRAGGLAGFVLTNLYLGITDSSFTAFPFPQILAGYVLGVILAEVVVNRPRRHSGVALLVARRLDDYLPGYVLVLQRGLAAVAVGLLGAFALSPFPDLSPAPTNVDPHTLAGFAVPAAVAAGTAVVIEALQRLIVARRQPITGQDDIAVDDAIRSSSLHVLAGAGLAMLVFTVAVEVGAFAVFAEASAWPMPLAWIPLAGLVVGLVVAGLFFWLRLADPHGFRVRRGRRHEVPA